MTIRSLSFDLEELPVQGGAPPSHSDSKCNEKSGGTPPQKEPNHKKNPMGVSIPPYRSWLLFSQNGVDILKKACYTLRVDPVDPPIGGSDGQRGSRGGRYWEGRSDLAILTLPWASAEHRRRA